MRVILKPGGMAVVLLAIGILSGLVVWLASANRGSVAKATPAKVNAPGSGLGEISDTPVDFKTAKLVIDPTSQPWSLAQQPPAEVTKTEFTAADLPGDLKHAVRLNVTKVDPAKFWCAQLIKRVPQPIEAGRNLAVRFWARSKTKTPVHVVFETGDVPHEPELDKVIAFTPDWKEYTLRFRTKRDHTTVNANFCLKAGITPGEVEISEVRVADFGP